MDAKTFFGEKLPSLLKKEPDKAREIDAIYVFNVTGDGGGSWTVDLKADTPTVSEGGEEGDCAVEISNADLETLLADTNQGMQLFLQGKLKVSDPMLATKLVDLLNLG